MPWDDGSSSSRTAAQFEAIWTYSHGADRAQPDGAIIEPFPARQAQVNVSIASQSAYGIVFRAYRTQTVGAFIWQHFGSMGGATGNRFGLYTVASDGSMTMVARNMFLANSFFGNLFNYSLFNNQGGYPNLYQLIAGQTYMAALWQNGSASCSIKGKNCGTGFPATPALVGLPQGRRAWIQTGITSDLPTSIAAGGTSGNLLPWIALG